MCIVKYLECHAWEVSFYIPNKYSLLCDSLFAVFSRLQSSDFPIECHVTDILWHGPGVNVRRRTEDQETGTRGQYQAERRHRTQGGITGITVSLREIITRRMCLLVSCPRHHATCRLQTHYGPSEQLYLHSCFMNLIFADSFPLLDILLLTHYWFFLTRLSCEDCEGTCHVSPPCLSWQRVTCHERELDTGVCICPLSSLHIIIICQKYWTQPTRNIK